jgi:hypothetical protein
MDPVIKRRAGPLALLALCWCAMTGGVFSGCKGLFTPAVPEAPAGAVVIPNYRSPQLTLRTMQDAMAAKALGGTAWLGAFADSTSPQTPAYHHFFDAADVSVFSAQCQCLPPSDWSWSQEQQFFLQFLNVRPGDNYVAVFDPIVENPDPPETENEALLYRRYRVIAASPDETSTLIIATGTADITFTKTTGDNWLITRWVDHVDPDVGPTPVDPYQISLGRHRLEASR